MKTDNLAITLVFLSFIITLVVYLTTRLEESIYILLIAVLSDIIHRGIYKPLKESKELQTKINQFLLEHKGET